MAPSERPMCDDLADNTATWQEKAKQLLDILYVTNFYIDLITKIVLSMHENVLWTNRSYRKLKGIVEKEKIIK